MNAIVAMISFLILTNISYIKKNTYTIRYILYKWPIRIASTLSRQNSICTFADLILHLNCIYPHFARIELTICWIFTTFYETITIFSINCKEINDPYTNILIFYGVCIKSHNLKLLKSKINLGMKRNIFKFRDHFCGCIKRHNNAWWWSGC